jgi:formate hydrogenlyase subunit 6/NADH:ubiquinone oxidoreductase subunit I
MTDETRPDACVFCGNRIEACPIRGAEDALP